MTVQIKDIVELISALAPCAWPIVILIALCLFRKPIWRFADRVASESVMIALKEGLITIKLLENRAKEKEAETSTEAK